MAEYTGHEYVARQGTTALGIIGTALGGLAAAGTGMGISGLTGGNNYVSKEAYEVQLKLIDAQKENAILAADLSSEKKMVEVFNAANNKINSVRDELQTYIRSVENRVNDDASAQGIINANVSNGLTALSGQVATISATVAGITRTAVPQSAICDFGGGGCSSCSSNI